MALLCTASQVNLLIYHYLKESGFHHACFALRNESRLDDEPLSHEAVVVPGRLVEVLEKGLMYMSVEAHVNEDGTEKACSAPFSLVGPEHICDGVSRPMKEFENSIPPRLTPSPPPQPAVKLVETATQTIVERRSESRASSNVPSGVEERSASRLSNGRAESASAEDRSSKVASSSKSKLSVVPEKESPSRERDGKRKLEEKAGKVENKRSRRDPSPAKPNGRSQPASDNEGGGEEGRESQQAETAATSAALPRGKKKKRGGASATKGTQSTSNGAAKSGKGSANAWTPALTGKAKGKQIETRHITKLKGHNAEVFVAAWNPAVPGLIASGAGDATVRIWDLGPALASGGDLSEFDSVSPTVCKHLPSTHAKDVSALSWNPDGTLLASGSYDGILRLWTSQGDLHLVMSMHQGPIFAVRWNRKGNFILTGSADGTAIVWDLNSGKVRQQFSSHSDSVLDIDWLTGSMSVASVAKDPPSVAANNTLATCSADNSINILRLGESKPVKTLKGHTDEVNAIRFDATGTLLASVSDDATARIWNLDSILGVGYAGGSQTATGRNGGSGNGTGGGGSYGGGSGKRNSTTPRPTRGGSVDQMDVDESASSVGDTSGGAASELLGTKNGNGSGNEQCRFVLKGHKKDIFAAAWAPYELGSSAPRLLATASFDSTARIWNAEDGTCLRVFQEHTDSVYSVCFSPDRRFLVTGGMDHRLFVSSVETGDVVAAHAAAGGIFDVSWLAGRGRAAAAGSLTSGEAAEGGEATVKTEEGETTSTAPATDANASSIAVSVRAPAHLAISQADKTLTVLDLSTL